MMRPIDTKKALQKQKLEERKQQGKEVDLTASKMTSESAEPEIKEPFVYNYKPKFQKPNTKESARERMAREPRTFGASIETLDFSDNDLNDSHGQLIVNLIKSQAERRDHELWL